MAKAPRAFLSRANGVKAPVDKIRFAIADSDGGLLTSLWTVWAAHNASKPDFYATVSGMQSSHKFSFHKDILSSSVLFEAFPSLADRGIVPSTSRHFSQKTIPTLPWVGLIIRFPHVTLRRTPQPVTRKGYPILALPRPAKGQMLEISFVLSDAAETTVEDIDFAIGHLESGGRTLILVGRTADLDEASFMAKVKNTVAHFHIPKEQLENIDETTDLSSILFGDLDNGGMFATEVHNLRGVPPPEAAEALKRFREGPGEVLTPE